jgi:hypothetical protein
MQIDTYSELSTDGQSQGDDVRQKVEETASTLVDQAQQVASAQASTQKERAAQALDSVAKSLYESGSSLRENQPQIAAIADQAASRVVDASAYLREHDLRDLVTETEGFARREPLIFLGAAFALGFAAARFMKASAPRAESFSDARSGFSGSPRTFGSGYASHDYTAGEFNGGHQSESNDRY